jgi:signal transduction histidine kinase
MPPEHPRPATAAPRRRRWLGPYARTLIAPLVVWGLLIVTLREPIWGWLRGENSYDRNVLREWLTEARGFRETLPEMIEHYIPLARARADLEQRHKADPSLDFQWLKAREACYVQRENIGEHLRNLGVPPTKIYAGTLPLFPIIYRLQVDFKDEPDEPIVWDSGLPSDSTPYQEMHYPLHPGASVYVRYQLHAYHKQQEIEQQEARRVRQFTGLAIIATLLAVGWSLVAERRERDRHRQRERAQQQLDQAERRHAEAQRELLEQRLATQAAEQQALELKSQLWASIGIMAGSYAHNIKNLLVRPNDLLRRCLEADSLSQDQVGMLHEVQHTLGTVTERLQQILRTVQRDPTRSDTALLDLNAVCGELEQTWHDLAHDKWKLEIALELDATTPLWVTGDASHLQQAIENLLFNARDAVFEMRNHLRSEAHRATGLDAAGRREALIAAAAWRGCVVLRTLRRESEVVLEVQDNGAGMTEEVRRRCTETHFSTKRDNALYEGHSTGMGLGLSFVVTVLEHHRGRLEIDSTPLRGTTFRLSFPAARPDHAHSAADGETARQA